MTIGSLAQPSYEFGGPIGPSGDPAEFNLTTGGVPGSGGARSKADIPTYDISGPEDLYTLNKRNRQLSSLSTSIAPLRLTTATLGEYQQRLSRAYAKPPSTLLQLGAREGVKLGASKSVKYGIDKAFPGFLTQTMSLPPTYALSAPSAGASMAEVLKFASQPVGTAATGTTGLSAYSSFTSGAGAATTSGAGAATTSGTGAATTGFSAGIGSTAAETLAMQSTRQTAVGLGGQTATLSYNSFMNLGQQGGQTAFTAAKAPVLNVPAVNLGKGMTQAVSQEAAIQAADQAALAAASGEVAAQGGTKVITTQTMARINYAMAYIQVGYDIYRFISDPGPATGGAAAGAGGPGAGRVGPSRVPAAGPCRAPPLWNSSTISPWSTTTSRTRTWSGAISRPSGACGEYPKRWWPATPCSPLGTWPCLGPPAGTRRRRRS